MNLIEPNFNKRVKYFVLIWLFPLIAILAATNEQINGKENTIFNETFALFAFVACNIPVLAGYLNGKNFNQRGANILVDYSIFDMGCTSIY